MSSHHIVKEKQEPALYIDDLGLFNEELLGQLLEWSPTLMVSHQAYDKILSLGLKVDVLVNATHDFLQENTRVIHSNKDALHTALDFLVAEDYPAVNIITSQFDVERFNAYIEKINLVIFTDTAKVFAVKSGFSVWKPKNSIFKILSNSPVTTSNLSQDETNTYSVTNDGFVQFTFTENTIFISEQL